MSRQEIVETLRALPGQIEALVRDLDDEALRRRPAPDEWSIKEVCAHLRDSLEIDGERVRRMVEEDDPSISSYDQEALAREHDYQNESMSLVLTALRAFSGGSAYVLEGLSEEQWQRGGRHEERGPIDVGGYAEQQAEHVRAHLEQLRSLRPALGQ
ncbi:MAG TPA: DinB family protein [Dehalococcoidia bacterium]|nr:DinB family protein [Dehalococcoidia bacterium]